MSIFRDPDCLDRVSASLGAIAGICSVVPGATPVAVSAGLLSMAAGGMSAWRGRLENSNADANDVLEKFFHDYKRNWRKWSALSESDVRNPGDIESAIASFEFYFNSDDPRRIPSAYLIVANGRDAKKISEVMLNQAAAIYPKIYGKLDQRGNEDQTTKFSRKFFASVTEGGLKNLLQYPGFANLLIPAMQDLAIESNSIIKENREIGRNIEVGVDEIKAKLRHLGNEFRQAGQNAENDLFTLSAENTVVFAWYKARPDWWDRSSNLLLSALDRLGPEYQLAPQSWDFGGFDMATKKGRSLARSDLWEGLTNSHGNSHAASIVYISNMLSDAIPSDSRFEDRLEKRGWLAADEENGRFFVADGMTHVRMRNNIKKGLVPITLESRLILETMMADRPLLICDGTDSTKCSAEVTSLLNWLGEVGVEIGKAMHFMTDSHWTLPFARSIFDIDSGSVPNPYRRLDHYTIENAADFFGRDTQTTAARIWFSNQLSTTQTFPVSVLAITGPSGVGKSSFLNARVAKLAQERKLYPLTFRPTDLVNDKFGTVSPILGFCTLLAKHLGLDEVDHPLVGLPNTARASVAANEWIDSVIPLDWKLFFVIDQFEEIVDNIANNWSAEAWRAVLELVAEISNERSLPLAITLEDSRREVFKATMLDTAYEKLTQIALTDDDQNFAKTVITQPFWEAGFKLEEDLVARLLEEFTAHSSDKSTSGSALPLLTLKLYSLFNFISRNALLAQKSPKRLFGEGREAIALRNIEGFPLSINEEIKNLAEQAWSETDGGTESDLGLFLRPFVSVLPSDENQLSNEGRLVLNSVPARMFYSVANRQAAFLRRRLIVPTSGGYRLTHQSIIRHWPLAAAWFKKERESIFQQELFLRRAYVWEQNGRPVINTATSADVALAARLLSARVIDWAMNDLSQLSFLETLNRSFAINIFATNDAPDLLVEGSPTQSQYIHLAAGYGMTEVITRMLLKMPEAINFTRNDQRTVLGCAAWTSSETVAFLLEEHDADPLIPDDRGFTAIDAAIWGGNDATFDKLLSKIDPTKNPEERVDPLYSAAYRGRMDIIHKLEQRGFRHEMPSINGYNSLFGASVNGDPDLFDYCLARCNVAQRSSDGKSAFDCLAQNGKTSLMQRLLLHPKGYHCLDAAPNKTTALMLGAQAMQPQSVRFLLKAGLDPNDKSLDDQQEGRTALHYALDWLSRHSGPAPRYVAEQTREILVALLESNKIDVNLTDKNGKSPYDMARHHPRLQDLIASHSGFNPNFLPSGIDSPLHKAFKDEDIVQIQKFLCDPAYVKILGNRGENNLIPATEMVNLGLESELLKLVETNRVNAWPEDTKGMLLHSAWKTQNTALTNAITSKLPETTTQGHVIALANLLSDVKILDHMNEWNPKLKLFLSCIQRCPNPQAARDSAIIIAAKLANIPLYDQMLQDGAKLNCRDNWGRIVYNLASDYVLDQRDSSADIESKISDDVKTPDHDSQNQQNIETEKYREKLATGSASEVIPMLIKSPDEHYPDEWGRMPADLVPDHQVLEVRLSQSNQSFSDPHIPLHAEADIIFKKLVLGNTSEIKALLNNSFDGIFPDVWGRMPADLVPDHLAVKVRRWQSNRSFWYRIRNEIIQRFFSPSI